MCGPLFFKDIRRFYRLIFKHRFHRCDKRKDSKRQLLVSTILKNLGIIEYDYDVNQIFNFFYPVLDKLRKGNCSADKGISQKDYFSDVFVSYNKEKYKNFLEDGIGSQLIWFFLFNYSESYLKAMEIDFRVHAKNIIKELIDKFSNKGDVDEQWGSHQFQ